MDIENGNQYVSCIKIRGVPIIPPLMTEDIRTEMMYYKRLAIAVEERLKNLELKQTSSEQSLDDITQDCTPTPAESSKSESITTSLDKTINTTTVIDIPKNKESSEDSDQKIDKPDYGLLESTAETTCRSWKSFSDDETNCQNDTLTMDRTASSEVITASTDINQYLNGSLRSDSMVSTIENSPETRKPEVPKTLNIVPITVDSMIISDQVSCQKTGNSSNFMEDENDNSKDDNQALPSTSSKTDETVPKLVRQGSYVLDSPSPMLLAHLQEEMKISPDYMPTSVSSNAMKRKEWNISQAKSDWELQRKNEAFVITDSSGTTSSRIRRNSASNAIYQRGNGYLPQSRANEKHLAGNRQVARSADCIRSMIYRENNFASSNSYVHKNNSKTKEAAKRNGPSNMKSASTVSILNLANKLGGSLGCLSTGTRSCKRTPQKQRMGCRLSKSFDNEARETPKVEAVQRGSTRNPAATKKLLSAVTSEKLVDVFKEIQNTHERQMIELMARQQKEQQMMQKEFEKQQLLLLAQIEQTFPGICLPRLAEKIPITPHSPLKEHDGSKKPQVPIEATELPPRPVEMNGSHIPANDHNTKCPLDDIYPREISINSPTCQMKQSQSTQTLKHKTTSPPIGLYSTSVLNGERRNSGVNRQLFPLESKTRHVPVLNNILYEERHIKAATIITAYARGYLIRRLMQTERVVELKTTYKEALHCMLKLHVDAPLALPELNFHQRLQLQCDAASMNIVELFAQSPTKRMEIIRHDRQIKRARQERPNSARSTYSFATQRTLARKKMKEMGDFHTPVGSRPTTARSRCQTWASNVREKRSPSIINQGIKRSTSAGAVRKPWR